MSASVSATFRAVLGRGGSERNTAGFVLPEVGRLAETRDTWNDRVAPL